MSDPRAQVMTEYEVASLLKAASDITTVRHRQGKVVLTNAMFKCTECGRWKPAAEFGLRKMGDGKIRNQAQCTACRGKSKKLTIRL